MGGRGSLSLWKCKHKYERDIDQQSVIMVFFKGSESWSGIACESVSVVVFSILQSSQWHIRYKYITNEPRQITLANNETSGRVQNISVY
jgi:hypothetical protein